MRYAILSDIHANYEALDVALETLEEEGVDQYLVLGDLVGYNASPGKVVDRIRELDPCHCITGNHDRYLTGETSMNGVRGVTVDAIKWTKEQITEEQLEFIEQLENQSEVSDNILLVHGSPRNKDEYILSMNGMRKNLRFLDIHYPQVEYCFFGHTHVPSVISGEQLETDFENDRTIQLVDHTPVLINPGSVGQPRDGNPLSSFALYDTDEEEITIFRREYDIAEAQRKIREAELGEKTAERIAEGY